MCHPEVPAGAVTPDVTRHEVEIPLPGGETLPALLTAPESGFGGGVLIVHDVMGRSPFYEDLAARLATAGFHGLLPDFFFRQGPLPEVSREAAFERRRKMNEAESLADMGVAVDWLRARPGVDDGVTGTAGFCMGGTFVLQLAAEREGLATVCFYGFPAGTIAGYPGRAESPIERAGRIGGPILGFWGDQDAMVGMDNVERFVTAVREHGVEIDYTIYPGMGHGFMAASRLDPAHEAYQVACESWTRTIEFYRANLKSGS